MLKTLSLASLLVFAIGCTTGSFDDIEPDFATAPDAQLAPPPRVIDASIATSDAASAPTRVTTDNVANTTADVLAQTFTRPPTKPAQITKLGALTATALTATPAVSARTSAMGGTCVTMSKLPDNYLVGSSGAEGCIVAVIAQCDGTVIACHFTATDNPVATLAKLAPFGACAHAAIAGGTNERESNLTLMQVIAGLTANEVVIDGILDRIGVFWDATNGRWVYGPLDTASRDAAAAQK